MKLLVALFTIVVPLLICGSSLAQGPKPAPTPAGPKQPAASEPKVIEPAHELTAADAQAFLDGFVPMQLERENIAGAVVLIVKDGKVLFGKGYGYSDVEKKAPVSVDATLFRPGSISKLFTWTSVMQLVEQGKLDLDRDINDYLDFKIPPAFGKPITLRHLMTHSPGFEEQIKDLINEEGDPIASLRDHLTKHVPERIYPPGVAPAYSNYGAGLAGYIVERTSGRPFNEYVAENIFKPLAMAHSTFVQPLPADLKPLMSAGYNLGSGKARKFEIIEEGPAGSLSATASDLARFMIAHLQDGKFENVQVLRPETARTMHSRQLGLSPALNGMCLGFYEETRNGHRIFGHGGDTVYFHSDLHLMPDAGLGFYVSYNSAGKGEISPRTALWEHFLDRYFPYQPPAASAPSTAVADAQSVAGRYVTTRRSEGNFLKVASLLQPEVTAKPGGLLEIDPFKDFNGELKKWQEISPLVYRSVNGQDLIAFRRDENGRMQMVPNFPAGLYQRATLLRDSFFNLATIISAICVMALTLIFWPIAAIVRRHYHQRLELDSTQLHARLWVRVVCLIDLVFLVLMALILLSDDAGILSTKLDVKLQLIQALGALGVLGTVMVLLACIRSLRIPGLWFWAKVWNVLVLLACLGFSWFAIYWKLVNFNTNY